MFQGTEACLSSVQAHSITALAEAEKQTQGANSCSISETESDKFKMWSEHWNLRSQNSTEAQENKKSDPYLQPIWIQPNQQALRAESSLQH